MNRVILIGRLVKDPDFKKTQTDISYVSFTLAVNRNYQNKNGERQADFINCVAWRNTADAISRFFRKGMQVGIEGQIQTRTYDDMNGVRRYITEVLCDNFYFLEPKKNNQDNPYDNGYANYNSGPQYGQSNYQNNRYGNQTNNPVNSPKENPFEDIYQDYSNFENQDSPFAQFENKNNQKKDDNQKKQHDISNDDLPF